MYISDKHKIVFIHIPKTGGNVVRKSAINWKRIGGRHNTYSDLPQQYVSYDAFTIVRHPIYRMISLYRFQYLTVMHWNGDRMEERWGTDDIHDTPLKSFSEFLDIRQPFPLLQVDYIRGDVEVMFYEKFGSIQKFVRNRLGVNGAHKTRKTNYLGKYNPKEWADKEGIERMNDECMEDFKMFDYKNTAFEKL